MFNASEIIEKNEFRDVEAYRLRKLKYNVP